MKKKYIGYIIIFLIFDLSLVSINQGNTNNFEDIIYVDDDNINGPWIGTQDFPFKEIQDGINVANNGDTIFVFKGRYKPIFIDNKCLNIIGENKTNTYIEKYDTLLIGCYFSNSNGSKLINFTICNCSDDGIVISGGNSINISNNILRGNEIGISIYNSRDNHIINNIIINNKKKGIDISLSNGDTIENNVISNTSEGPAISLDSVYGILIKYNNIYSNKIGLKTIYPKVLPFSKQNRVNKNNFINNTIHAGVKYGISLFYTRYFHNYWGRPRILPKIIISLGQLDNPSYIPCNIDFFPSFHAIKNR